MFENPASGAGWADEAWHHHGTVLCVSVGNTWHSLLQTHAALQQQERTLIYSNLKIIREVEGLQCGRQKGAKYSNCITPVSNPVAGQRGQVRCSVLSDTGKAQIPPPSPSKGQAQCDVPEALSSKWRSPRGTTENVPWDATFMFVLMKCAHQGARFLVMEQEGEVLAQQAMDQGWSHQCGLMCSFTRYSHVQKLHTY